jgi:hypothetical protein
MNWGGSSPKILRDGFGNVVFVDDWRWLIHHRRGSDEKRLMGLPIVFAMVESALSDFEKKQKRRRVFNSRGKNWKCWRSVQ